MIEIEVASPPGASIDVIEKAISDANLDVTLRGTLRQYPNCHHWHLKKTDAPGTLELTWWPDCQRVWFKIASNRRADWMDGAIEAFSLRF
jgi:hypothetical protein